MSGRKRQKVVGIFLAVLFGALLLFEITMLVFAPTSNLPEDDYGSVNR